MDFSSYTIGPPHGVWRMLTTLGQSLPSDTGFLYSNRPFTLAEFVEQCKVPLIISGSIAEPSPNSHDTQCSSNDANVWLGGDYFVFYRSQGADTQEGYYYLGWFELPETVDLLVLQTVQVNHLPSDFKIIQKSRYIDLYSPWKPAQLLMWYNDNQSKEFEVIHNGTSYTRKLRGSVCEICYGIHRECPLSSIRESLRPHVQTSRKRSLSDDEYSSSVKQPRAASFSFKQRDSLLVRDELVRSVVERVRRDHFLLVSYDLTNDDDL